MRLMSLLILFIPSLPSHFPVGATADSAGDYNDSKARCVSENWTTMLAVPEEHVVCTDEEKLVKVL